MDDLPNARVRTRVPWDGISWRWSGRRAGLAAVGATALLTGAMLPFRSQLGVLNPALLYLLLIVLVSLTLGGRPAIAAAIASFLTFDFFFIEPYHDIAIASADDLLALIVYLGIAVVIARLTARARERTEAAEREARRTGLLYELNAALVRDVTPDAILATIVERVVRVYGAKRAGILLPNESGELSVRAAFPAGTADVDRQALAMAAVALAEGRPVGLSTAGRRIRAPGGARGQTSIAAPRGMDVLFLPIATGARRIGVLEVSGRPGGGRFSAEDERMLLSFADQAALALERARLHDEAGRAAVLAQSDELKSALLAAVSHDLRTPLAVIKASSSSLLDAAVPWTEGQRRDLLEAIDEEVDRLTSMVSNLLDMSRIEAGALRPEREWYDIAEVIVDVTGRLASRAAVSGHTLTTAIETGLPLVRFDYIEIAQVLTNLIENALTHTPAGCAVEIAVQEVSGAVEVSCRDDGPGIPVAERTRVFDKFQRIETRRGVRGTGIGLAIAKGLVEAHGGRIWVEDSPGRGATFRFTLPLEPRVTTPED